MKIIDIMSKHVDYVSTETKIKDVCRLIFGRSINGIPVCKGKKVVGFVTEKDIIAKFFPSIGEYVDDPVHSSDFEGMEKKVSEVLDMRVEKIMSHNPTVVTSNTALLKAQSLMLVKKVGRLPVVDDKNNLVGVVSKSDIFRVIVGDKIPYASDEEYHDWLSKHYDLVVPWKERLGNEVPDLTALFKKEKIENILDIGCGTGEHDIALAKNGFNVYGLETSTLMNKESKNKLQSLSEEVLERVKFINSDYIKYLKDKKNSFGGAIFMGNAFCHLANNYKEVLGGVADALNRENSVIVLQIVNFQKLFKTDHRFQDLNFKESKLGLAYEHAFLEFYDPPRERGGHLTLNMAIFDFNGKKWKFRAMNSTQIVNIDKEGIEKLLRRHGFNKISFYGGMYLGPLFKHPFNLEESDWLIVVAKR